MGGTLQKHGETAEDLSNVQPFGTIRILSYNLFMRPPAPHFTHNVVNDLKDERLEIFQQQLKDYDVICLQECFGAFSSRRGRLIEEARRQGFFWHVLSPMSLTSGFLVDGGLLILSKVPISQSAYTIFSRGKFSDALAAKGAIYARMELAGDVVLHVFTTHLQASYHEYGVAPSAEVRARQLDALVHFISECTRPSSARGERSAAEAGGAAEAPGAAGAAGAGAGGGVGGGGDGGGVRKEHRVLVLGDLNIDARSQPDNQDEPSEEYKVLRSKLGSLGSAVDIIYDTYKHFPVTFGDVVTDANGKLLPAEETLTAHVYEDGVIQGVCQTLDYIWLIDPSREEVALQEAKGHVATEERRAKLTVASAEVNPMRVEESQRAGLPLSHLSDHLAVQVQLEVVP